MSHPSEPTDPVIVAQPSTEIEAAILKGQLEGEGIRAWVLGGLTSGFRAEAPGRARVVVRAADADRARAILAGREPADGDLTDGED